MVKYALIGAAPAVALITYANLLVGDAIPYDQHPVSRWLARYVMEDPAIGYYKNIYHLESTTRWERQTRLIGQVQEIQKLEQEGAYAWFTDPAVAGHTYEDTEEYIK